MKPILIKISNFLTLVLIAGAVLTGCKKFSDIPPVVETYNPDSIIVQEPEKRKVLLISIDGLKADFLSANLPTNISALLGHSKYMFVPHPAAFFPINNTSSWGSMLTGNSETRLWDSSFFAVPDTTMFVPVPPNLTVARYIKNHDFNHHIVAISPWEALVNNFLIDANKRVITTHDEQTKNEAVNRLRTENPILTILQFIGLQTTGIKYGFTSVEYKNALQQVDAYIGEIMETIANRRDYANEKWLTLITTAQVRYPVMNANNYLATGQFIPEFTIAHSKNFIRQNLSELRPPLYVKREDMAANILYWLKMNKTMGIRNSIPWLNNFELEAQ